MSDNNKPYKGLDEANQHIEALKELHLPFLPIDAKMSINLALKRCEEVLEPFNERAQALKEEEDRKKAEAQKRQAELEAICAKEGHVGKWKEGKRYYEEIVGEQGNWVKATFSKPCWTIYCKRCHQKVTIEYKPAEIRRAELQAQIDALKKEKDNL